MQTSSAPDDRTPVIIGVGEASERIDAADYAALSPADLAAAAARAALADTGAPGPLQDAIDVVAAIRQFEVSGPGFNAPFGCSNNFPRSVAQRIGAHPARAVWEKVGGQGPQHLVNEFAHAIAAGEAEMVLLVGSEAISTVRHLTGLGQTRDWSETVEGDVEDRGLGLEGLLTAELARHGARTAYPRTEFCTDNAAMIALAGHERLAAGERSGLPVMARARWPLAELRPPGAG